MRAYILVDRSGSMTGKWDETLSSVNAYVNELAKAKATKNSEVTAAVFDSTYAAGDVNGLQFDVVRKGLPASYWTDLTDRDASPRGYTPLYDAVGRLMAIADKDAPEKAVIVIVTDGAENASKEVTRLGARALLDGARAKGWQVIFLGANFEAVVNQAADVGTRLHQTINTTNETRRDTMALAANYTTAYAQSGAAIAFSPEDRKRAAGRGVDVNVRVR
jgi:hypothetical protein